MATAKPTTLNTKKLERVPKRNGTNDFVEVKRQ